MVWYVNNVHMIVVCRVHSPAGCQKIRWNVELFWTLCIICSFNHELSILHNLLNLQWPWLCTTLHRPWHVCHCWSCRKVVNISDSVGIFLLVLYKLLPAEYQFVNMRDYNVDIMQFITLLVTIMQVIFLHHFGMTDIFFFAQK